MKKILFLAGGVLIGWGAFCWYKQEQNKKQHAGAGAASAAATADTQKPDLSSPAHVSNELSVQETRPVVEMTITDEPALLPDPEQAIRYYNTNPSALFYRPRTTIAVDAAVAEDIITIDSANTYSR